MFGSVAGAADPPPSPEDEGWPHEDPGTIVEQATDPVLYTTDEILSIGFGNSYPS